MKNLYGEEPKLNLEEIFTNDEIKSLKKTFQKINILITPSSSDNYFKNVNNQNRSRSKIVQENNSKDKIYINKMHYYKLILENIKSKYEQEGNNIMLKSISCLINDLFFEQNNSSAHSLLANNNDYYYKNEKGLNNKRKQLSTFSLHDKNISDLSNDITIQNSINIEKNSKSHNREEKAKKIKSPNNNYKNIYYYNIINSKKIINNNNFKNDEIKKNQKFIIKNDNPLYSINYSMNLANNNINKINSSNMSFLNYKNLFNNLNNNYSSSIQIYSQTDQNKNNKINLSNNLNKKHINQSSSINSYNYFVEKRKRENYQKYSSKDLSNKIKSVKFLVRHISTKKNDIKQNKSPFLIRNANNNIYNNSNIEASMEYLFNPNKYSFMNVDANSFSNIENQNFNIFELNRNVGRENILPVIGYYIFNRLGFYNILKYNKFENWCRKIAEGYIKANSYHTDLHAADITHTCLIYLKVGKVNKICKFSKNSKCALFLSCICHDYKHPGVNNNYLKETRNEIAIRYNDISILENMHIAETFKLINNSNNDYNIFQDLDNNTYKQFRKEMIACVLSTDMTFHNIYIDFLKKCCENKNKQNSIEENNNNKADDYQNYMNVLIHSADISNPTKPFDIYFEWAKLVIKEFYNQGDKEKKLNMTCSCDRNKVTIYQSQLGFINYIELAYFSLFVKVFENLSFYMDNLNNNKEKLLAMQEKEKEKDKNKDKDKKN